MKTEKNTELLEEHDAGLQDVQTQTEPIDESQADEEAKSAARLNERIPNAVNVVENAGESEEAVKINPVEALGELIGFIPFALDFTGYEKAAAIWQPPQIMLISKSTVKILHKYAFGKKVIAFLESGALGIEEIILIGTVFDLGKQTYGAVMLQNAENKALAQAQKAALGEQSE